MTDRRPEDRLEDLLVEQATSGLGSDEARELERLLTETALDDPEGFERAAAALDLVFAAESGTSRIPLPADLAARIAADADRHLGRAAAPRPGDAAPARSNPSEGRPRLTLLGGLGWAAAAAAGVALYLFDADADRDRDLMQTELLALSDRTEESAERLRELNRELVAERGEADRTAGELESIRSTLDQLRSELAQARDAEQRRAQELDTLVAAAQSREEQLLDQLAELEALAYAPSPDVRLERLLARADDLVRVPWSTTPDPLVEGSGAGGEVIWSDEYQEGYMVFDTMRSNSELGKQFQLWIFSSTQSPETPVDGGVFDVGATAQRLVVPIDPKLVVDDPSLFAVTLEKPGGVVVSSRERLVLVAQVD